MKSLTNKLSMITEQEIYRRRDMRDVFTFTIDPADAKDFDDAVSIKKIKDGIWEVGIHIADVSHYVKEDSNLDREALKRGTSVYLVNRVVPMLPKVLSNGICSLNPDEDRLTLSCIMEIDDSGQVVNHTIEKSVINSCARLVYDDVSDILEHDDPVQSEKLNEILAEIKMMGDLAEILRNKRKHQGSLDFDLDEAVIEVDEYENPIRIEVEERRISVDELVTAAKDGSLEEVFGTGTAAVISPVGKIVDHGREICMPSGMAEMGPVTKKLYETLTGIQMGRIEAPEGWILEIDAK